MSKNQIKNNLSENGTPTIIVTAKPAKKFFIFWHGICSRGRAVGLLSAVLPDLQITTLYSTPAAFSGFLFSYNVESYSL